MVLNINIIHIGSLDQFKYETILYNMIFYIIRLYIIYNNEYIVVYIILLH